MPNHYLPIPTAQEFITNTFVAVGVPTDDATVVANLMLQSDLAGADGHGIFRLPAYIKRIKAGGINLRPNIRLEREQGAVTLMTDSYTHLTLPTILLV